MVLAFGVTDKDVEAGEMDTLDGVIIAMSGESGDGGPSSI